MRPTFDNTFSRCIVDLVLCYVRFQNFIEHVHFTLNNQFISYLKNLVDSNNII